MSDYFGYKMLGDRQSIWYSSGEAISDTFPDYSHPVSSFIQDLENGLMPYGKEKFNCKLECGNSVFETKVIQTLTNSEYSKSLKESVEEFVEDASKSLSCYGFALYELVEISNKEYTLIAIPTWDIKITKHFVIQQIPKSIQKYYKVQPVIKIDKNKCIMFEIPKTFCTKKDYVKALNKLSLENKLLYQSEVTDIHLAGNSKVYDFSAHHKMIKEHSWYVTRKLAWHHRAYLSDSREITDYYLYLRQLRFKRNQIILRDYILEKVNEIISLLANINGVEAKLYTSGLLTLEEVDEAILKWEKGELSFKEVLDTYLFG